MDVSSLYTNIPNDEGIAASLESFMKNRNEREKPSLESLGSLLNLVLKCNNFQFDGSNYLQVGGTAMGTRVARILCKKGCRVCPALNRNGKIKSKKQKDRYTTMYNVNCQSSNLVYCIKCKICKVEYVGQTKRILKERINEHISSMKNAYKKTEVSRHFCRHDHNGIEDMQIFV